MPDSYGIIVCSKLRSEFKQALIGLNREDIIVETYEKSCGVDNSKQQGLRLQHAMSHLKSKVDHVKVIGPEACIGACSNPKNCMIWGNQTCLEFFIPKPLFNQLIEEGAYLTTPGWLLSWRKTVLDSWGFNETQAQVFFADFAKKIVLLDTQVHENVDRKLKEFAEFLGLPCQTLAIGTSFLELKLQKFLSQWTKDLRTKEAINRINSQQLKLANLGMLYDLIPKLANSESEQMVLEQAMSLLRMLFAPKSIICYRVEDGKGGFVGAGVEAAEKDSFLESINSLGENEVLKQEDGFIYTIKHEGNPLVYFGVQKLTFPKHLKDYLDVLSLISSFLGLFIAKARQRDELVRLQSDLVIQERELADYNKKLEGLYSELQEGYVSLETAVNEAQEAINTKDKFFSILGHDLRSPFNGMLGFSELLINEYDDLSADEHKEYLGFIHKGLQSSFQLLNDLLSWSRSQRDVMPFNPITLDLEECLDEALKSLESIASKKGITITSTPLNGLKVFADQHMLTTILRNLLGNAIKFSFEGGHVLLEAHDFNGDVILRVVDKGVGMTQVQIQDLFDVSKSRSSEGTNGETGSGLGLILCHEFVQKHGGSITVRSQKGAGSTFELLFPKAESYSSNGSLKVVSSRNS